jgi:hypothetical protein
MLRRKTPSCWSHTCSRMQTPKIKFYYIGITVRCTARAFRTDSPGKSAQWLTRSIRESWGVLWLVIHLLSVQADVSSSVPGYLDVTVQENLRSGWPGPFVKVKGVLWLVICLLSLRAYVSSSVIKAFFLVLHSPPHLSACWSSPHHYPYFSYSASEDCHV